MHTGPKKTDHQTCFLELEKTINDIDEKLAAIKLALLF